MIKLVNIEKHYQTANEKLYALKEINVEFRKNEFVSILGPSGCGKTTLLNIIGGLDCSKEGDLIINGKSTENYKDEDWDYYRNCRVGFVFQNYNLISYLTVLENVEIALTLSGISKKERRKKAVEAIEKVGLKDKINEKPNQLSGGQMQRVAIARAIVNDPQIILADEPTGSLDSKTSVQIMDILNEISKEKLVIMVTHNVELAENYSTRIISLMDGKIINDSNAFDGEERLNEKEYNKNVKKTSMSFIKSLIFSFKNLLSKKIRTCITITAISIGIMGISLVLSISNGLNKSIDKLQNDTLSTFPLTISNENSLNFGDLVSTMEDIGIDLKRYPNVEEIYVHKSNMYRYKIILQRSISKKL